MNKNKLFIYGNGSLARLFYSYLRKKFQVYGFVVDDCCIKSDSFEDLPLVAYSKVLEVFNPADFSVFVAVGFVDMNRIRLRKISELETLGYGIEGYIHESFVYHDNVTIGSGSAILEHVSIHPGTRVEKGVFLMGNNNLGHDCRVENGVLINAGACVAGGTTIGAGCFLGVNAAIANDIVIGPENYIGAGALINTSIPGQGVYVTDPAKRLDMNSVRFLRFSDRFKQQHNLS